MVKYQDLNLEQSRPLIHFSLLINVVEFSLIPPHHIPELATNSFILSNAIEVSL